MSSSSTTTSLLLSIIQDSYQQQQQQLSLSNSNDDSDSNTNSDSDSSSDSPKQQLWLCITLMTLSGLLRVVATMFLAYPDHLKKKIQSQSQQQSVNGTGDPSSSSSSTPTITTNNNFDRLVLSTSFPILISCHITLLFVAAMTGIVGSFYGPIAIAVPIQTGSQLLFNVVFMGILLKMRLFTKSERTGTYVVFLSVLCLIDVGPGTQDNQNIMKLLSTTIAIVWSFIITFGLIFATIWTFLNVVFNNKNRRRQQQQRRQQVDQEAAGGGGDENEIQEQQYNGDESSYSSNGERIYISTNTNMNGSIGNGHHHHRHERDNNNETIYHENNISNNNNTNNINTSNLSSSSSSWLTFVILLSGVTLSNVAMATSGKTMGYLTGLELVMSMGYYIGTSILGLLFSITSSTKCEQGLFTPASSVALILLNFITGIIIWEDWKVMETWVSYVCSCLLMCCGVYLLAEFDILEHYYSSKNASTVVDETLDVLHIPHETITSSRDVATNINNNNNNNGELRQPLLLDDGCVDNDDDPETNGRMKRPSKQKQNQRQLSADVVLI